MHSCLLRCVVCLLPAVTTLNALDVLMQVNQIVWDLPALDHTSEV